MNDLRTVGFEMFDLFELTPDLVCIAGKDGYFRKVNPAVIEKLGYTKEELFERPIASFIYHEDKDLTQTKRQGLLGGKALLNFQNRYVSKSGKIFWFEWTSIYIPEREIVFAIAKDISERKQIEKEIEEKYIQFRSLATHFKSSLEDSKKYLAMELHEELAQLASVVKMDLNWVMSHNSYLAINLQERLEHALTVTDLLINAIQRISFSISPGMLDDLGLNAVLEWQCKEFSIMNGIPCLLECAYQEEDLTREIKLDFFRVCQESLTNAMYHAEANKVWISIKDIGDKILLTIKDDGKGFEIGNQKNTPGLSNIRGLVALINGELSIQSEPGSGTTICVMVAKP